MSTLEGSSPEKKLNTSFSKARVGGQRKQETTEGRVSMECEGQQTESRRGYFPKMGWGFLALPEDLGTVHRQGALLLDLAATGQSRALFGKVRRWSLGGGEVRMRF